MLHEHRQTHHLCKDCTQHRLVFNWIQRTCGVDDTPASFQQLQASFQQPHL